MKPIGPARIEKPRIGNGQDIRSLRLPDGAKPKGGPKMIGVIAKLKIKEGKMDEALNLFKGLLALVRKEEGTLYYTLNRDMADPNMIVVVERYKDMAAFQAHTGTPHFLEFSKKIGIFLDGKLEMNLLEETASR